MSSDVASSVVRSVGLWEGPWWGWEGLQAPISSPDTNSPRETGSTSKLASTHLLQDVWTLSPSVPLNSFPLPRQRAPILSGLSYCQFVFIKFTILARHWEISETQIWFWWKGDIKWVLVLPRGHRNSETPLPHRFYTPAKGKDQTLQYWAFKSQKRKKDCPGLSTDLLTWPARKRTNPCAL